VLIDSADRAVGIWMLPRHDDEAMTYLDFIPQETLFWRRRIWDAAGGCFDARLKFALDWDLLLRFRQSNATFACVPRFLGAFRVHEAQKTQRQQAVCEAECDRLRRKVHGRPVSHEEAVSRLKPYYRRHLRAHIRQRLLDRLPAAHTEVTTVPPNAWLRTPQAQERAIAAEAKQQRTARTSANQT
jgi:hypothetical protein